MKIEKINPQGFCGGVKNAIKLANDALKKYDKPIYMLGKIIHNDIVCKEFEKQGYIINLEDKSKFIERMNSGTVLFTAHGVDDTIINNALDKGLNVIDTTCPKVKIIHNKIKENILNNTILYVGVKGHPECEGVLSLSKDIILITKLEDLESLDKEINYYVTNQTTLSLLNLEKLYSYISNNFNNAIIDNKICLATTNRQKAVIECEADCIIVVGDSKSSNTNELYNIASTKCDSYLVDSVNKLNNIDFSKYCNIKITSGASTPEYITDEVYKYLITTYIPHQH